MPPLSQSHEWLSHPPENHYRRHGPLETWYEIAEEEEGEIREEGRGDEGEKRPENEANTPTHDDSWPIATNKYISKFGE